MKTKLPFLRNWTIALSLVILGLSVAVPPMVAHSWPAPAPKSAAISLERTYVGSVNLNWSVPGLYSDTLTAPAGILPDLGSIDLGLLAHCSGTSLSGYMDLSATLVFPGMYDITTDQSATPLKVGPAISGTCSDASWQILSEQFTQTTGAGQSVKRQFQLIGALDATTNTYKGEYRETLWGYGSQPFTIVGDFTLLLANPPTLSINKVGNGTVTADKSAPYHYGDVVQLIAAADSGWTFTGWSGDCSGTGSACTVTMDAAKSVTATFILVYVPQERVTNGGFNTYPTKPPNIPKSWFASKFASTDGKDKRTKREGAASVKIAGAPSRPKTLWQNIALSGSINDAFTLSYWIKGSAIPTKGTCQVQVLFYTGTKWLPKTFRCPSKSINKWKKVTLSFTAPAAYTKMKIKFTYNKASGTVWFDKVSLMR